MIDNANTAAGRPRDNGEVFQSPQFALMSLQEAVGRYPEKYRFYDPATLKMIHPGSFVKVVAVSVGQIRTEEEMWLLVKQMAPISDPAGKLIGEIRKHTGRSKYHGLEFRMLIYFQPSNVIDVILNLIGLS